jgi:hypothetical protein
MAYLLALARGCIDLKNLIDSGAKFDLVLRSYMNRLFEVVR